MKKTNEKNGITLIALVITIIVLLILAGTSTAALIGNNGLLIQAKLAKENTAQAKKEEENNLANNNNYINEQTGNEIPGKRVTETKKNNYIDSNGDKATIPEGFTVSKIAEEQKIAEGLVIYDIPESEIENVDWKTKNKDGAYNIQTLYNQFVWIPVENAEKYQRDFSYPSFYFFTDVGELSETTPENSTFTDTGYLPSDIQPEIDNATNNEEAERTAVLKYNGFYIARYEAGNENSKVVSKQNSTIYTGKSQEMFKTTGREMYGENNANVKSAMCSGIQWDMAMKFVDGKLDASDNENNIFDVKSYNLTRHKDNRVEAGKNLADKVQNIYDLEGNYFEYVAEKNSTPDSINIRGGYARRDSPARASLRGSSNGGGSGIKTFRLVLYII